MACRGFGDFVSLSVFGVGMGRSAVVVVSLVLVFVFARRWFWPFRGCGGLVSLSFSARDVGSDRWSEAGTNPAMSLSG